MESAPASGQGVVGATKTTYPGVGARRVISTGAKGRAAAVVAGRGVSEGGGVSRPAIAPVMVMGAASVDVKKGTLV